MTQSSRALTALAALAVAMSVAAQPPPQSNSPPAGYPTAPAGYQPPPAPQAPVCAQPPANCPPTAPAYQPPSPQPAQAYPQPPAAGYQLPPRYVPPQPPLEDQRVPYHVHRDARNGHDHVYPDRGSVVRDVPRGALIVNYAGVSYRFYDGVWFEPRGPVFVVIAPPIGLVVQTLPAFATPVARGAESYFYANEVYYRPRPDIGGYEVVNDLEDEPLSGSVTPSAGAPGPAAAPIPAANPMSAPVVTPAATAPQAAVAAQAPLAAQASVPAPTPVVAPPPVTTTSAASAPAGGSPPGIWASAYPKNGQSADQQARDHYACYQFGVAQTGYDPLRAGGGVAPGQSAERRDAFERARAACFEGRGYSIR